MSSKLDKAKGKLEVKAGKAKGDKKLEARGHLEQAKGKAKEAAKDVKKGAGALR